MGKGFFISFEGGEGAGKTTQIKKLAQYLESKGHDVVTTREPGGTPAADALWQCFIDQKGHEWDVLVQALLVFTTRRLHVEERLKKDLAAGKVIICDRFTDSTRVYQGIAGGLGLERVEQIKQMCIGDFEPDLTFIFDIDPKIGLARSERRNNGKDTFEEKHIEFHEMLRNGYRDIANTHQERCFVIDASQSIEAVEEEIRDICLKNLI